MAELDELRQELMKLQSDAADLQVRIDKIKSEELLKAFETVRDWVKDDLEFRRNDYGDNPEEIEKDILNDRNTCIDVLDYAISGFRFGLGLEDVNGFDISSPSAVMSQVADAVHIKYERYIGDDTFLVTLAGPDKIIVQFTDKASGIVRLAYEHDEDVAFNSLSSLLDILDGNINNKGWR